MLKGTCKVVKNKNMWNYAPLIEVFMQYWFIKEEEIKQMPLSTSKGANKQTTKHIKKTSKVHENHIMCQESTTMIGKLRWNEFTFNLRLLYN